VIASFRSTMNKVAPRFRVQCRRQALVAYCRRCSAILSELQFTIVTGVLRRDNQKINSVDDWIRLGLPYPGPELIQPFLEWWFGGAEGQDGTRSRHLPCGYST